MIHAALLRGAYFGPFEAQNFEPMLDRIDVRAYVLPQNRFDLQSVRVPVTVCAYPDSRILGGRSLINGFRSRILGERYPMPGLEAIVRRSTVVHTFEAWYSYTQQAARYCKRHGVPLIVTHWETHAYRDMIDRKLEANIRAAHESVRCFIAPTTAAKTALVDSGVSNDRIVVQPMGVDTERFSPGAGDTGLRRQLGIEEGDFVFLYVGRLAPEKGLPTLMQAFAMASRRAPGVRLKLLVVGSGPEEQLLRSMAERERLEGSVIFTPARPYPDLHRWYRLGDVFVLPSIPLSWAEEQFAYAIVEAMSCGLPVITTTVGGIADVVGDAGMLTPPGEAEPLANAMITMLSDSTERTRYAGLARARALERFSSRAVAGRLAAIYESVCR